MLINNFQRKNKFNLSLVLLSIAICQQIVMVPKNQMCNFKMCLIDIFLDVYLLTSGIFWQFYVLVRITYADVIYSYTSSCAIIPIVFAINFLLNPNHGHFQVYFS